MGAFKEAWAQGGAQAPSSRPLPAEDVRWDRINLGYLQQEPYARLFAAELAAAAPLASVGAPRCCCCRVFVELGWCDGLGCMHA